MGEFFDNDGQTIESPGMVRWESGNSHYFLKKRGNYATGIVRPEFFRLGLEHKTGDGKYYWSCDIEFDVSEAPDLMDRICEFNGLPKYSDLLEVHRKVNELIDLRMKNLHPGALDQGLVIADLLEVLGQ